MNRTPLWLTVFAAGIAASVFAQVSPQYRNWEDSALRYLMMTQEKTDWASLRTDSEAKAFIELFWARRDPTPETPDNELRQQIETRIAEADKRFGFGKTPGSQTDRGLLYTLVGEPTQIVTRVTKPGSAGSTSQFQRPINIEAWIYRNEASERVTGTKSFDIAFNFYDERNAGELAFDGPSRRSFDSTALATAKAVLKRPFLTAADLSSGAESARTVAFRLIVVANSTIAHDVLRRAQEGDNFADLAQKYSSHPSAQQGGYVGRVAFADLTEDFKLAFAGKEAGTTVLIARSPQFAVVRLLTEAEARAADAEMANPK